MRKMFRGTGIQQQGRKFLGRMLLTAAVASLACGTVAAAENPYADAPAGDWSYEAIDQLIQAHVISGYDAEIFRKDKTATRYEMARFLANGLSKYDQASPEQQMLLDKLADSYRRSWGCLALSAAQPEAMG